MNIGWNCERLTHTGRSSSVGGGRNKHSSSVGGGRKHISWTRLVIFRNVRGTAWTKIIVTKKASVPCRSYNNLFFTDIARSVRFLVCSPFADVAFWTHLSSKIGTSSHANCRFIGGLEGAPPDTSHRSTKAILGSLAPQACMVNMSVAIRIGACMQPSKTKSNRLVFSWAPRTIRDVGQIVTILVIITVA